MVCNGRHWTEANGKQMMNEFSQLWTDAKSWKKRAKAIKDNIQNGMQWDKISQYSGHINVIKHSKKIMDGYSVENIALESFFLDFLLLETSTAHSKNKKCILPY